MSFSFQKIFFALATTFALFAVLILAKTILIPLGMALLISFILFPVSKQLEAWGTGVKLAAFMSVLGFLILVFGGITLFSAQIIQLSSDVSSFSQKLMGVFTDSVVAFNENISFEDELDRDELLDQVQGWLESSAGALVKNTFSNTASFVTGLITTIIFAFLFLIYRVGLTRAFMSFAEDENRDDVFRMLKNVQEVGQKYLFGMAVLVLVLGVLNSSGLWLIGIENPVLFGFLAASLSIIPFVGTILGASVAVLYAFMTHDALWVPLAVIGLFWFVQTLEGNFLNPKIVGRSVNVNAFAAILSLVIGAAVWGVAGMILFLPFAAMLKVVCGEFEQLRPIAALISSDISGKESESERSGWSWPKKLKGWLPGSNG